MDFYQETARGLYQGEKERDPALGCRGRINPALVMVLAEAMARTNWASGDQTHPAVAVQKEYDQLIKALRNFKQPTANIIRGGDD
jgi:hypothetical protein